MVKGAKDPELKEAFKAYLAETQGQVTRLEEAGQLLGINVTGKKCFGMEGCIQEGAEALEEEGGDAILDLGPIGASWRADLIRHNRGFVLPLEEFSGSLIDSCEDGCAPTPIRRR